MNRLTISCNAVGRILLYFILLFNLWTTAECKPNAAILTYDSALNNQRPRFKIPRGNLSYYRNPQWEILYYLKFGTFPAYTPSAPYLNRTEYLEKARQIKTVLDESSRESDINFIKTLQSTSDGPFPLDLTLKGNEISPEISKKKKQLQEVVAKEYRNQNIRRRQQRPLHFNRKRFKDESDKGTADDAILKLDSNKSKPESKEKRRKLQHPLHVTHPRFKKKGNKYADKENYGTELDPEFEPGIYDYMLLENIENPDGIHDRVTKQVIVGDFGGAGSDGLLSDGEMMNGFLGGLVAEMSIERKNSRDRKFQTQGWK